MQNSISNKIFLTIITLLLLLLNIFVGHNLLEPLILFFICVDIFFISYVIFCIINKKRISIIDNKLDLFVILYLFLPIIPYIFKSNISVSYTYRFFMQNMTILLFYLLIKNIATQKNKAILINIIIYSSIPIIIIGFDRMYTNYIWNYLSKLDCFKIIYDADRLVANFNYPNTLGIYLSSILILTLGKLIINNNKIKSIIYNCYSFILLLFICLTESRATLLLLVVYTIIYLILLKNNIERTRVLLTIFNSTIFVSIYLILFKVYTFSFINKLLILLFLLICISILNIVLECISDKILKFNYKKIFIVLLGIIFIFILYIFIFSKYSKPTTINDSKYFELKNIGDKVHNIKIDIDTNIYNNQDNNFKLEVIYIDKYSKRKKIVIEEFNISGIKEYTINETDPLSYLIVKFDNLNSDNELIINKIYIDNKEYIINYKYMSNKLANIIKSINFTEKSMWQRIVYYKDGLKLFKNNILVGNGSYSWKLMYRSIVSYSYVSKEVHSIIIDTLISYGIIGISILLLLLIYLIYYGYKLTKNNKEYIYILNALLLIITHSFIDFDMSFLIINIYVFTFAAIISSNFKIDKKNNTILNIMILFSTIIILNFNVLNYIGKYKYENLYYNDSNKIKIYSSILKYYPSNLEIKYRYITTIQEELMLNKEMNNYDKLSEEYKNILFSFLKEEPYYSQVELLNMISSIVIEDINNNKINYDEIRLLYNIFNDNILCDKYNLRFIINRTNILINIYNSLKNKDIDFSDKYKKIVIKEYENNINNLNNYKKTDYEENEFNNLLNEYKKIVEYFLIEETI